MGLSAVARPAGNGRYELSVGARRFAQSVQVDIEHFQCGDDYFHLAPGERRRLTLVPRRGESESARTPGGSVRALNAGMAAKVTLA